MIKGVVWVVIVFGLVSAEANGQGINRRVGGVYRIHAGMQAGFEIWVVDGATVRRDIYPEFLYGGNSQRYLFIPRQEIWIDNAVSAEEFLYTRAHELAERVLMAHRGWSYNDAHTAALDSELVMRHADEQAARAHEERSPRVSPTDADGEKEIAALPDSISLDHIYRVPLGMRRNIAVWVVDGAAVRREIYPDFGLSGNDLAYHFIPLKEIWIDGQISCEETEFSVAIELTERELMAKGLSYDDAYERAVSAVNESRKKAAESARERSSVRIPPTLDRTKGTGNE